MDINIFQREFDELLEFSDLYKKEHFRARKEALDLVAVIKALLSQGREEIVHFQARAQALGEQLSAFNETLFDEFLQRLVEEKPSPTEFREWLMPYTLYSSDQWGAPHHGYEDIDFLLEGVLVPEPHPQPGLKPEYGMLRYEPTPASVILELTERLEFGENDRFYDLGSGLGKVTSLTHLLSGVRCVGVEYQPDFCAYAETQAQRLGLDELRYINHDARNVDYANATIFFLFNPFGGVIFDDVFEKIRFEAKQRALTICSYGSSSLALSEFAWLEETSPRAQEEMSLAIFRSVAVK